MIVLIPWDEFTKEKVMEKVKDGDTCVVMKDGKKVAEINPPKKKTPSWKKKIDRIKLDGDVTTDEIILKQREEARW